jgi:hypothetical protein
MMARVSSIATCCPALTMSSATVPSNGAVTACSIFIASTMRICWPGVTRWPSATFTASTVPGIGLATVPSPEPAASPRGVTACSSRSAQARPSRPSHSRPPSPQAHR